MLFFVSQGRIQEDSTKSACVGGRGGLDLINLRLLRGDRYKKNLKLCNAWAQFHWHTSRSFGTLIHSLLSVLLSLLPPALSCLLFAASTVLDVFMAGIIPSADTGTISHAPASFSLFPSGWFFLF